MSSRCEQVREWLARGSGSVGEAAGPQAAGLPPGGPVGAAPVAAGGEPARGAAPAWVRAHLDGPAGCDICRRAADQYAATVATLRSGAAPALPSFARVAAAARQRPAPWWQRVPGWAPWALAAAALVAVLAPWGAAELTEREESQVLGQAAAPDGEPIPGTPALSSLTAGRTLQSGEEPLRVEAPGTAQLALAPRTVLDVEAWEPARAVVRLRAGVVTSTVEHRRPGQLFEVRTPEAVVRVVGTRFVVERSAAGTRVETLEGVVRVESPAGALVAVLRAGEQAAVAAREGAPPTEAAAEEHQGPEVGGRPPQGGQAQVAEEHPEEAAAGADPGAARPPDMAVEHPEAGAPTAAAQAGAPHGPRPADGAPHEPVRALAGGTAAPHDASAAAAAPVAPPGAPRGNHAAGATERARPAADPPDVSPASRPALGRAAEQAQATAAPPAPPPTDVPTSVAALATPAPAPQAPVRGPGALPRRPAPPAPATGATGEPEALVPPGAVEERTSDGTRPRSAGDEGTTAETPATPDALSGRPAPPAQATGATGATGAPPPRSAGDEGTTAGTPAAPDALSGRPAPPAQATGATGATGAPPPRSAGDEGRTAGTPATPDALSGRPAPPALANDSTGPPEAPAPAAGRPAQDAPALLASARSLLADGRASEAADLLRAAAAHRGPHQGRALALLGDALRIGGHHDQARRAYEQALTAAAPPPGVVADLASLLERDLGAPGDAARVWRDYLDAHGAGRLAAQARWELARLEPTDAERHLRALIADTPDAPEATRALVALGRALLADGRWSDAEDVFTAAREDRRPARAEAALVGLMRVRLAQGRPDAVRALAADHAARFPRGARADEVRRLLGALR